MPRDPERERIKRAAQLWRKRPARSRRLGSIKAPASVEAQYALALRQQARGFVKRVKAALEPLLRELARQERQDAESPRDKFESTVQRLRRQFKAETDAAKRAVDETGKHNTEALNRWVAPVTGRVPIWKGTTVKDRQILSRAVTENMRLIRSIPERLLDDVENTVLDTLQKGSRVETIRDRLQERYAITERQAELIARDQVLKLNAQLVEQRSQEMGIERYTWRTSLDERVRPTHQELEGTRHTWDDPPITHVNGDRNHPGEDYQCLPGNVHVAFPGPVSRTFRRWVATKLTLLVTDAGEALRCTPNHPVLTQAGWQPAQLVDVGDHVFEIQQQVTSLSEHAVEHRVLASDVFEALVEVGGQVSWVSGVASQFHNDGVVDQEVDVVDINEGLFLHVEAVLSKQGRKLTLPVPDPSSFVHSHLEFRGSRHHATSCGGVGSLGDGPLLLDGGVGEAKHVGIRATADPDPAFSKLRSQTRSGDPVRAGDSQARLPREVRPYRALLVPRVIAARDTVWFEGWVYNFSTHAGWYTGNGLVTHNCRCTAEPDVEGLLQELGV